MTMSPKFGTFQDNLKSFYFLKLSEILERSIGILSYTVSISDIRHFRIKFTVVFIVLEVV